MTTDFFEKLFITILLTFRDFAGNQLIKYWLPSKMLVAMCMTKVSYLILLLYKIYTMYSSLKHRQMCIFDSIKQQSSIRFIVDALFGTIAYLHSLYTVVELHTIIVLIFFHILFSL